MMQQFWPTICVLYLEAHGLCDMGCVKAQGCSLHGINHQCARGLYGPKILYCSPITRINFDEEAKLCNILRRFYYFEWGSQGTEVVRKNVRVRMLSLFG